MESGQASTREQIGAVEDNRIPNSLCVKPWEEVVKEKPTAAEEDLFQVLPFNFNKDLFASRPWEPRSETTLRNCFKVSKKVADVNCRMPKQWTLKYMSGHKKRIQCEWQINKEYSIKDWSQGTIHTKNKSELYYLVSIGHKCSRWYINHH